MNIRVENIFVDTCLAVQIAVFFSIELPMN